MSRQQIRNLRQKLQTAESPEQKQRIERRMKYLRNQGGAGGGLASAGSKQGGAGGLAGGRVRGGLVGKAPIKGKDLTTAQGAIQGQFATNLATTQNDIAMNRPGEESNPYGNQTYSYDENGNLVKKSQLSDPMQQRFDAGQTREMNLLNQQNQAISQFGQQGALNYDGLPSLANDFSQDRNRIEDSVYNRFDRRMGDRFSQQQEELQQQLANRGIPMGSERYNEEMNRFNQSKNDAYLDAKSQAVQMGGAEQQNMFNMNLTGRQQGINERTNQFYQPLQTAQTLQGMQQGVINPQFQPMYQAGIAPTDVQGTASNFYNTNTNAATQQAQIDASRANAGLSASTSRANNSASNAAALQRQREAQAHQAALAAQQAQNQPKQPNPWASAGAGFVSGLGSGLGNAFGGS